MCKRQAGVLPYDAWHAIKSDRAFDLETDRRVAEFKFIHWRGRDAVRQDALLKDFYKLAEHPTTKRKELYVLDSKLPLKFLRGGRALSSVLRKSWAEFQDKYGDTYKTVGDYYSARRDMVTILDATPLVPQLLPIVDAAPPPGDEADECAPSRSEFRQRISDPR